MIKFFKLLLLLNLRNICFVIDLLVGVLSVLTDIVWRSTVAWNAGNIACKIIRFSQVSSSKIILGHTEGLLMS